MQRIVVSILALFMFLGTAPVVAAYDPNAAVAYADQWWNSQNPAYPSIGNDCANFVSQALHAGGYPFHGAGGDTTLYKNWYSTKTLFGYDYSFSWTSTTNLLNFLWIDAPGGSPIAYKTPSQTDNTHQTSGGSKGDVLFYDWGAGEGTSHSSIQVGYGTDPTSKWVGSLVDMHTSYRSHAFWSLYPYNADRASFTHVTVVKVSANN